MPERGWPLPRRRLGRQANRPLTRAPAVLDRCRGWRLLRVASSLLGVNSPSRRSKSSAELSGGRSGERRVAVERECSSPLCQRLERLASIPIAITPPALRHWSGFRLHRGDLFDRAKSGAIDCRRIHIVPKQVSGPDVSCSVMYRRKRELRCWNCGRRQRESKGEGARQDPKSAKAHGANPSSKCSE